MPSSRMTSMRRNGSSRSKISAAATAALNDENVAEGFLERLKNTTESDEVAYSVLGRFTSHFSSMHAGKHSSQLTKHIVINMLIDEAPAMVEEFISLFDTCCNTFAWAGQARPANEELAVSNPSTRPIAAEAPLPHTPLGPSYSGIENISTNAGSPMVGTVSGSGANAGSRANNAPKDKLEWLAVAKRLVPAGRGTYALWFTLTNVAVIIAVFAYMAGDYAMWVKENRAAFTNDNSIPANTDFDADELLFDAAQVPEYLKSWLSWTATWQTFSFEYLKAWGGRWAPALERGNGGDGSWWLWVTSIYVHQNLQHIVSNLLLFVAISVHLELNYGWWRLLLVWLISGIGANLISATFESACTLLVGASGAVFGFMGLFVADLVINFESISWPFLRALVVLLFIVFFIANAVVESGPQRVSHASHIGGLICGLFPSLLFLPNLRNRRFKALQRQINDGMGPAEGATTNTRRNIEENLQRDVKQSFWTRNFFVNPLMVLGVLVVIAIYVVLPIYLYSSRLKDVCCAPDAGTSLACVDGAVPQEESVLSDARRRLLEAGEAREDPWGEWVRRG